MNLWHRAIRIMVLAGFLVSAGIGASEPPAKTPPAKTPSSKGKKKPAPASPAGSGSQTTPAAGESRQKEEAGSPGLLDNLWNKVREMMIAPEEGADPSAPRSSAVAGVRGAKSDDATVKPIWKGKSAEPAVPPDVRLYEQAKAHFAKAEYAEAVADLQAFQKQYPLSPAKPQAELLLALGYARSNHSAEAVKTLDEFLAAHPGHPLAEEVKQLKAKLAGGNPK